jgi:hypothetical protein
MTQRIPLDHLTSDQLDQLYEQLDRAEAHADPELHDRLDAALTALGRAETELIALRARGSGDATPLPEHIREQLRAAIESEVYEYRERTMLWEETGGVTEEIARLATRGAVKALTDHP